MCLHIFKCCLAHVGVLKYAKHPQMYLSVTKFVQEGSNLLLAHWCIFRCMQLASHWLTCSRVLNCIGSSLDTFECIWMLIKVSSFTHMCPHVFR